MLSEQVERATEDENTNSDVIFLNPFLSSREIAAQD